MSQVLGPNDLKQINRIRGGMPYGGLIQAPEITDVPSLIVYLESLRDRIEEVSETNRRHEKELVRLQDMIRGGGELLKELLK